VTIFDGIEIALGIQFNKIWRLQNYVSSAWTPQIQLVHVGGDELGSIYVATLKLKENWIRCAFLYNCNCHKRDWLQMVK
jgi:hypothetical protein